MAARTGARSNRALTTGTSVGFRRFYPLGHGGDIDNPKGEREAMDKEELRHPSLDLILLGGATGHSARATRRWREANCPAFIRKEGCYLCYPN